MNIARIYINDVEVGSLPITQYNDIVASVKKDNRLYIKQAWVFWKCLLNLSFRSFKAIPITVVLFAIFVILAHPNTFVQFINFASTLSADEIVHLMRATFFYVWMWLVFILLPSGFSFGAAKPALGFYNCFEDKVNCEVRRLLEVPSRGEFDVVRVEKINEQQ